MESTVIAKEDKLKEVREKATKEVALVEQKHTEKMDEVIDYTMYMIWANNPKLDTSFLKDKEERFTLRWVERLEKEEATSEVVKAN